MRIEIETVFSNGWRGKTEGTENFTEKELLDYATEKFNQIVNELSTLLEKDEKAELMIAREPYLLQWQKHSEDDPAHQQVRFELTVYKFSRKITANDIYATVNNIKVSHFY